MNFRLLKDNLNKYLVSLLHSSFLISSQSNPKRVGKWTCVYNHFVDKNSHQPRQEVVRLQPHGDAHQRTGAKNALVEYNNLIFGS